jgi:hypothetical protein
LAGFLFIVLPTVIYGGVSLLSFLMHEPAYLANKLRQDLLRAGHAHAGLLLVFSLVILRYFDDARLSEGWKWVARLGAPIAAILLPTAFFLSVLTPDATEPNGFIYLAFVGAVVLALGFLVLGIGLLREPADVGPPPVTNGG